VAVSDGWTLALDTAGALTVVGALAPHDGPATERVGEPEARPGRRGGTVHRPRHAEQLLALADDALTATGGAWDRLARVVVGLGPGGFTGIRVAVATGRALALARGATVVGAPTPLAVGPAVGVPRLVVQDARRKELFLTVVAGDDPTAPDPVPWAVPVDGLAAALDGLTVRPTVAVGDAAADHAVTLRAAGIAVPDDPAVHRVDGVALARMGAVRPAADAGAVRPVYVRDADAIRTADR